MSFLPQPKVVILNAALGGGRGNTAVLLERARAQLVAGGARVTSITLADGVSYQEIRSSLIEASAILIGSGTHWDSWSHVLQKFLEDATPDEATSLWLGKPAGVIVTMHSVGGKEVLSRLQGVLNTLGCLIPPMTGLVCSLVNQTAAATGGAGSEDLWTPEDIAVVCHNLLEVFSAQPVYRAWPVDRRDYTSRWISD